jgi:hypothetical protein
MSSWSRKDWAAAGVFVCGAAAGLFMAFMPFLIDHKALSLPSCSVIAVGLTLISLVLFRVQQTEVSKEEILERKENKRRDKLLEEILRNQAEQMKRDGIKDKRRIVAAEAAADLYDLLAKGADDSGKILMTTNYDRLLEAVLASSPEEWDQPWVRNSTYYLQHKAWKPTEGSKLIEEKALRSLAERLAKSTISVHGEFVED